MSLLMMVMFLLVCLLFSNVISHYIPSIPTALIQIVIGIIIALAFRDISFQLGSEWFLLLFVAPLLYNDGRHFPREELWKMKAPIFGNAIVLVLLTTVGGGYFIHWLVPAIPLAAAFALAAILSPTDPVAVNGIANRIHIPERVLTLVRGESLINDATGLVAFKYAVAAVVTGYFSMTAAVLNFAYIFIAGAVLGLLLGLIITWVKHSLRKKGISDVTFHSLLQVLTPFVIYIITEEFLHASGVIAVVVAGIIHSIVEERSETLIAEEKLLTENIWSIILFVLNGIVFLLLGWNIPSSMAATLEDPNLRKWVALEYVVAIGLMIMVIRFIWTYFFFNYRYHFGRANNSDRLSFKTCLWISITGVRGAVTMAGVLTIPYLLYNGAVFPERSLLLFLAAGVILFTLIVATVLLPLLSEEGARKGKVSNKVDFAEARKEIILEAIKKIKQEMDEENEVVAYELIAKYKKMLKGIHKQNVAETKDYRHKIREVRLMALKEERKYIREAMVDDQADMEILEILEKNLDHREEVLSNNSRSDAKYIVGKLIRGWQRYRGKYHKHEETGNVQLHPGKEIQMRAFQAALAVLEKGTFDQMHADIVPIVILDYKRMIGRLIAPKSRYNEKREEQRESLCIKIMDAERFEISRMYEASEIDNDMAKDLRRFINYIESVTLYEYAE